MYATLQRYHTYGRERRSEGFEEERVLVNLIIYNPSEPHERAKKEVLDAYLTTVPRLVYYFVTMCDQEKEVEVDATSHMIYVKGVEGYIPSILDKTMRALEYIHTHHSYSYLVRSNISTVLLWDRFPWHEMRGVHHASTNVLRFIPNLPFAQGTNIIWSHEAVAFVLAQQHQLKRHVIDDVALAELVLTRYPIHELHERIRVNSERDETGWVYRNRTDGYRDEDTERMRRVIDAHRSVSP